jgi:ATP-binding cassette subfamily B protein
VGRLVTRATNDVQNMHELFTSFISFVFKDLFLLLGIATVLLLLNPKLAVVSFIVLPIVAYASVRFSRVARRIFRELRVLIAEINTRFAETIGGVRVLQLFRQEAENYRTFKALNHKNYLAGMQQIHVLAVFMPLVNVLSLFAMALVIFFGGSDVLKTGLSLGSLVAFLSYIRMFFQPLRDLAEKYNILQNAMASAERIFLILDNDTKLPLPEDKVRQKTLAQIEEIRMQDVWFSYSAGEDVLKGVNLCLKRGQTVAVVGPTGAGKTSLINLIPRFYDPRAGSITINGKDIAAYEPSAYRSKMALVMQDPFLFSGTVRENIFEGRQEAESQQMEKVLAAAQLDNLIAKLPHGLDTQLAEGGASISSGERQLISIARAFARDPQLILFDEATSYIDSQTEAMIQQALSGLMQQRTSLIIAHRLSTVRQADKIVVLNRGRIIETGTHSELIAAKGFYYRLYQLENNTSAAPLPA